MMLCTVRIETTGVSASGSFQQGCATGFLLELPVTTDSTKVVVVTNKHVLDEAQTITLHFQRSCTDEADAPSGEVYSYQMRGDFRQEWMSPLSDDIDLCCLDIENIKCQAQTEGKPILVSSIKAAHFCSHGDLQDFISPIQEIFVYGYPTGLWDTYNNLPVIRRGTFASHPAKDFCGEPSGLLDLACFPGSSGSPVFILSDGASHSTKNGSVYTGRQLAIFVGVIAKSALMNPDGRIDFSSLPVQHQRVRDKGMLAIHIAYYIKAAEVIKLFEAAFDLSLT
jgi:hypothetical protein